MEMIDEKLAEEYSTSIKDQYGYKPGEFVWFLASEIANQYVRLAVAKKLGKDTENIERMIESKYQLICRNV
jgi:hypothetical protein